MPVAEHPDPTPTPDSPKRPRIELPSGIDSGDIVLFNRRCLSMPPAGAALCVVAKLFSNSRWDHVGVVIRHPATGELLFLEADFGGVKLRSLQERVSRSSSNEMAVRRLSVVRNDSIRERLYAFALEMLGRPYEIGTGSVMMRVADPMAKQERERLHALLIDKRAQVDEITKELDSAALTTFQKRILLSERERVQNNVHQIHNRLMKEFDVDSDQEQLPDDYLPGQGSDLSNVFCSELVAAAYQRVGLLEAYPPPFSYNPKDFSSEQNNPPGVHLLKSARLSDEIYMRRSSQSAKETESQQQEKSSLRGVYEGDKPSRESRRVIRDALKRTPLYEMVPDEYKRSHLIKSFRARIIEQGDVVFEQGEYGDHVYVIGSGEVERFMSKGDEDPILLGTIGARTSFGLTAFIFNSPRVSTIRAKERTLLWEVDRATFELFKDTSHDVKSIVSHADRRALRRLLQNHFLFSRLDKLGPSEMNPFFLVKFRAGEEVFKQGDAGDNFYIIKSGELERHISHPKRARKEVRNGNRGNNWTGSRNVTRNGNRVVRGSDLIEEEHEWNDEEKSLAKTLKAGQSFGELSLMYNAPRAATVRARTDAECWAISTESFLKLNLGSGTQYLRAIFKKNASVVRDGESYMTTADLLRFADADAFPAEDRERLSALLVSLVTSNREDPVKLHKRSRKNNGVVASATDEDEEDEEILVDFWEFVRFDIVLNQPAAEMDFAFRLADQDNSGFIGLYEMESLLQAYAEVDEAARRMLSEESPTLKKVFGRDGRRTLSTEEFQTVSKDILPPTFRSDVATITYHMLNMDLGADDATRQEELYEMSFVEPDGSPSVLGSQFVTSSRSSTASIDASTRSEWMERSGIGQYVDWSHLLSVGVSGAASRTVVAPLERLKVLMQTGGGQGRHGGGIISGLREMIGQDSSVTRALFRGNGANLLRIVPNAAIQLVIVERLHWLVARQVGKDGERVVSGGTKSRAMEAVVIGGVAGMVGAAATYPLDFVRGRLTVQRSGFEPYNGAIHGLRMAMRHEGWSSIYRGLVPTLAGVFPYVGLSFGMYETLRPILPRKNDGSGVPTTGSAIVCGAVASATGQMAAYPLDSCRRRMQVAGFMEGGGVGTGVRARDMWRWMGREGIGAFFRGGLVNVIKVAPASAVSYVAYEQVRNAIGQ